MRRMDTDEENESLPAATGFRRNSKGSIDWGNVDAQMVAGTPLASGPIRLAACDAEHLTKHDAQAKAKGYASVYELAEDVAANFDRVYEAKPGTLLLIKESAERGAEYIALQENEGVYMIKTAFPVRQDFAKNRKPLWDGAQSHQRLAASPSAITGQSSEQSVSERSRPKSS